MGYAPPSYNKLRTTLLQKERGHVDKLLGMIKETWKEKVQAEINVISAMIFVEKKQLGLGWKRNSWVWGGKETAGLKAQWPANSY